MPPVTREWFEARKETLAANAGAPVAKIWTDPLTKKKFGSENTYKAFVNSKKYKDLVKQSGQPAPQPAVSLRRVVPAGVARNGVLSTVAALNIASASSALAENQPSLLLTAPALFVGCYLHLCCHRHRQMGAKGLER